jgi:hypothetical protein
MVMAVASPSHRQRSLSYVTVLWFSFVHSRVHRDVVASGRRPPDEQRRQIIEVNRASPRRRVERDVEKRAGVLVARGLRDFSETLKCN